MVVYKDRLEDGGILLIYEGVKIAAKDSPEGRLEGAKR